MSLLCIVGYFLAPITSQQWSCGFPTDIKWFWIFTGTSWFFMVFSSPVHNILTETCSFSVTQYTFKIYTHHRTTTVLFRKGRAVTAPAPQLYHKKYDSNYKGIEWQFVLSVSVLHSDPARLISTSAGKSCRKLPGDSRTSCRSERLSSRRTAPRHHTEGEATTAEVWFIAPCCVMHQHSLNQYNMFKYVQYRWDLAKFLFP